jgi:hypothetical protein
LSRAIFGGGSGFIDQFFLWRRVQYGQLPDLIDMEQLRGLTHAGGMAFTKIHVYLDPVATAFCLSFKS